MTRILQKDSSGNTVAIDPKGYPKLDGYYLFSPGLTRHVADLVVKQDPALAAAILKANQ